MGTKVRACRLAGLETSALGSTLQTGPSCERYQPVARLGIAAPCLRRTCRRTAGSRPTTEPPNPLESLTTGCWIGHLPFPTPIAYLTNSDRAMPFLCSLVPEHQKQSWLRSASAELAETPRVARRLQRGISGPGGPLRIPLTLVTPRSVPRYGRAGESVRSQPGPTRPRDRFL